MILELTNNTNSYSFEVEDLNYGEKLYYKFQIPATDVEDGKYNMILMDGDIVVAEEQVCIGNFKNETIQYNRGENIYIDVELKARIEKDKEVTIDSIETTIIPNDGYDAIEDINVNAQPLYDSAFNDGFADGKQNQKDLLEPIFIQNNGVYSNENGYSEITVDVPDFNGSWESGYTDGKIVGYESGYTTGYNEGYNAGDVDGYDRGYNEGEENGVANAGEIIAQTARVLDITENGTYISQYSDPIYPDTITGVYPDGEDFYSLAKVNNVVYNTGIIPNETTKLEIWFEPDKQMDNLDGDWFSNVIDAEINDVNCFRIRHNHMGTEVSYEFSIKGSRLVYDLIDGINHIEMSYADGLIVNGIKVDDFYENISNDFNKPFYINGVPIYDLPERTDDGNFGMIKITTNGVENIIIPTEDGFKNITTDEMLEVVYNGIYKYINNNPIIPEGNLIKTVNVNVQPKVNVAEIGLKFGYSTFKKLPEIFDFSYVTDMNNMFFNGRLETLEGIDFSTVTSLYNSFYYCPLKNLDYFNNYPKLTNMEKAFSQTHIEIVPDLDLSNITNAAECFGDCNNLIQVGNLNLEKATNLSYFLKCAYDDRPLTKIGILNVPNVENMSDFFYYSFAPLTFINLTEMGGFIGLKCNWNGGSGLDSCPNLTYESCINILNGLADVTELGGRTLKVHQNFIDLVGDEISIGVNKSWNITA